MKTYTPEELKEIVRLHGLWLSYKDTGIRADLSNSDLRYSDLRNSDLRNIDLRGSNLSGSNLRGSNLSGSNLSGSNLSGSNLSGSNLSGSDMRHVIGFVYIGQRSDGYQFTANYIGSWWVIRAGCRELSIESYREHTASYSCDIKRQETLDLLDFAEKRIKLLGKIE